MSWHASLAVFLSLLLHLGLFVVWPGYGGQGMLPAVTGPELHARLDTTLKSAVTPPRPILRSIAPEIFRRASDTPTPRASSAPLPKVVHPESVGKHLLQPAAADSTSAGAGMTGREDYVPVELLDVRPAFLQNVREMLLPEGGEEGRVVLQLLVGDTGLVDAVLLERTDLSVARTREILQQLRAVRLSAGRLHGKPVKCRWRMEFSFASASEPVR